MMPGPYLFEYLVQIKIIPMILLIYIMYQQLGFVALLCFAYLYYILYRRPKKLCDRYVKEFESRGYRVMTLPYNPFSISLFQRQQQEYKAYKTALLSFSVIYSKYDVVISNALTQPHIVVTSPRLLKEFMSKQAQFLYEKHEMIVKPLHNILGDGLLLSAGDKWAKKRKVLNKVFKFEDIKNLHEIVVKKAQEGLKMIQGDQKQGPKQISFLDYGFYITETTILESFLGSEDSEKAVIEGERISKYQVHLCDEYAESFLVDPLLLIFGNKFQELGLRAKDRYFTKKIQTLNNWIRAYVKQRMSKELTRIKEQGQSYKAKDIFSAILKQNYLLQKSGEQGVIYSEQELVDEFKTFIFTGTDTSASALKIMIYLVFKHKEVQQKLREEIQTVLQNKSDFSFADLKNCTYLQAVFKETLRLHGPVNFNVLRRAVKDHYLDGVAIKKGTAINQYPITFHNSERYYKNPTYFRPERWLNGECSEMDPFNLVPFSSGNHSCIGKNLATLEVKIGMIMVLLRYKKVEIIDEGLQFRFNSVFACQNYKAVATI